MQMAGLARWGLVGSLLTLGLIGCGSDSDGGSSAPSYVGEKKSVMITADKGGTLEAGAVALNVPEGALAEDTELSVEVIAKDDKPDADSIAIDVYDFGPDGTKFLKPVTMEFDLKGVDLEGKDAFIAWLDGSSWQKLSDSDVEGGKITATTDHFTPFTVVLVGKEGGGVEQTGGMCDASAFKACGGDLVGTWAFTAGCLSLPSDLGNSGNDNSAAAKCVEIAATLDFSGDVTFGADGKISGTTKSSAEVTQSIDRACLAEQFSAMGMGQVTAQQISCDEFADADEGEAPPKVTESGDKCIVEGEPKMDEDTIDGTYRTEGNSLYVTNTGDTDPPEGQEYCVEGSKLTLVINGDNGTATIITAERK